MTSARSDDGNGPIDVGPPRDTDGMPPVSPAADAPLHPPADAPGRLGEPFTAAVAWAAELHHDQHRKGKPDVTYL